MTTSFSPITLCARNSASNAGLMQAKTTVTLAERISCTSIRKQLRVAVASTPTTEEKSSTYISHIQYIDIQ